MSVFEQSCPQGALRLLDTIPFSGLLYAPLVKMPAPYSTYAWARGPYSASHAAHGAHAHARQRHSPTPKPPAATVTSLRRSKGVVNLLPASTDMVPQQVTVNSPTESLKWGIHALVRLSAYMDVPTILGLVCERTLTGSSAFSGIAGSENSDATMEGGIQKFVDMVWNPAVTPTPNPIVVMPMWCFEIDQKCQEEIMSLPRRPQHIFGNLLELVPNSMRLYVGLDGGKELPASTLKKLLPKAKLKRTAWCVVHGCFCPVMRTDKHDAGSPCTDDSNAGLRRGPVGPNRKLFYVWLALCRNLKFKLAKHENVNQFDVSEAAELVGDLYVIIVWDDDCNQQGFAMFRKRQVMVFILKAWTSDVIRNSANDDDDDSSSGAFVFKPSPT